MQQKGLSVSVVGKGQQLGRAPPSTIQEENFELTYKGCKCNHPISPCNKSQLNELHYGKEQICFLSKSHLIFT